MKLSNYALAILLVVFIGCSEGTEEAVENELDTLENKADRALDSVETTLERWEDSLDRKH